MSDLHAALVLEDGRAFHGKGFGATGEAVGEACFNTSMTGYQEVLTDPSYRGQIVCMTYPLIGNYGVNAADAESRTLHPRGFVVKEISRVASSHLSEEELPSYLARHGVVGLAGIDTRSLTRHLRDKGAMRAILATGDVAINVEALAARARKFSSSRNREMMNRL